jgi:hypothetical protein
MTVCNVTETEPVKLPPLGLIVGVATVGRLFTVKLKVLVLVTPPPAAVTVIREVPAGVELVVLMVRVEEQVGPQEVEEKEAVAPAGRPEAEKVTASVPPDIKVALIKLVTDEAAVTDLFPVLLREKSKGASAVGDPQPIGCVLTTILSKYLS